MGVRYSPAAGTGAKVRNLLASFTKAPLFADGRATT
jgi:hypothetical protein